ncbi:MAG: SDR family NAD(P)-dependent oxidoreductase, partial [Actinobacteria bacterium]|nr:SDR family NAD(P)-dependent oxidoreductase [Actinomycetota bacterium]
MTALTPNDVPGIDDWNQLLAGRTAVVTGGGAGIGRATVELFVAHGAEVHVAELDPDLVVEVGAIDGVIAHHVDVRDPKRVTAF